MLILRRQYMILMNIHIRNSLCFIKISFPEIVMKIVDVDLKWKHQYLKMAEVFCFWWGIAELKKNSISPPIISS